MRTYMRTAVALAGLAAALALAAEAQKPARDPLPVSARIDREIDKALAAKGVPASPAATDAEFCRRLHLDLLGRIPSAEKAAAFLADTDPAKRRKLIDELLAEPEYGQHFGTVWYHRIVKPTVENRALISKSLLGWLAERFNDNVGWDKVVRDILTAEGDRDDNPATVFFLNHVDNKRFAPPRAAATASHLFLGVKLECCECHDHPFDSTLKQTDFWGVAAFFNSVRFENAGKKDPDEPGVVESRQQPPRTNRKAGKGGREAAPFGSVVIPDSKGKTVKATFLHAKGPADLGSSAKLRATFAGWVASPKNPYFARATVNKLWANFFGRGLVEPVDDMTSASTSTHPELLKALADEFAVSGFDTKHLVRAVCNSKAYQRSSVATSANKADEELYSHIQLKVMTADMLFDSLATALGHSVADRGREAGRRVPAKFAAKMAARNDPRQQFRDFFHAEADDDAGVIDEYTHGIPQVLRLLNAKSLNDTSAVVAKAMKAGTPEKVVDALYLRALSRPATPEEAARAAKYVAGSKSAAAGYGDLYWALLNSAEFLFIH